MQNNVLKYVVVCLMLFAGVVSVHAQTETVDTIAVDEVVDEVAIVNTEENLSMYNNKEGVSLSPQITDYKQTKEWRKHKLFKTLAFTSLGVGVVSAVVILQTCGILLLGESSDLFIALSTGISGPFLLGSIPLFILAHKNKVKAKKSVTNVGVGAITAPMSGNKREIMPALTFSLSF